MSKFNQYLEEAKNSEFIVGNTYILDNYKVKYLGLKKDNPDIKINSEIGDKLTDKPVLLFKWLEGDQSISSHGINHSFCYFRCDDLLPYKDFPRICCGYNQ